MAIIYCPECGNEVSDKAKKCPHCGISIFVCPECGKISIGEGQCTNCGYSTVPPQTATANNMKEQEGTNRTSKNLFERWKEINSQTKNREKILSAIGFGAVVLGLVLVSIWLFHIFDSYLHVDLESLLTLAVNHRSNLNKTKTYFAIIIVLEIAGFLFDFTKKFINYAACAKWIRRNKIELGDDISLLLAKKKDKREKKKNKSNEDIEDEEEGKGLLKEIIDETKEEANMEGLESALFLAVDPNRAVFLAITKIIPGLFEYAATTFLLVCLKNEAISFMNSVLLGDFVDNGNGTLTFTYNYSFDWLTLLIGCAIAIFLAVVSYLICNYVREKKIERTLQKIQNVSSK